MKEPTTAEIDEAIVSLQTELAVVVWVERKCAEKRVT